MPQTILKITEAPFHILREKIISKEISVKEIVNEHLERIEELNPSLQSYFCVLKENALERAGALDYSLEKEPEHLDKLPLLGMTFSVSDYIIEVHGAPLTNGSLAHDASSLFEESCIISRLCSLGAVVLGKTHVSEFYTSDLSISPICGPCRNPWDLKNLSGGPAGGGASAVAAGLCSISIGANLRGGTELPANHCGVYSLCLSKGKTPMVSLSEFLLKPYLHYGITARNPKDLAIITNALATADCNDPDTYPNNIYCHEKYMEQASSFSIGWMPQVHASSAPKNCEDVFSHFLSRLEKSGHKVERVFFQEIGNCHDHAKDLIASLVSLMLLNVPEKELDLLKHESNSWIGCCREISSGHYYYAKAALNLLKQQIYSLLNTYDIIATPVSPLECIPIDQKLNEFDPVIGLLSFIWPFSLIGVSRLIIPCGLSKNGHPVGMQLICREKEEGQLLRFANEIEKKGPLFKAPNC